MIALPLVLSAALAAAPPEAAMPELAAKVREEIRSSWNAYRTIAWGHDEARPVSRTARDWYGATSLLMTPVDALDTLLLADLKLVLDAPGNKHLGQLASSERRLNLKQMRL